MDCIVVRGGEKLNGSVRASGSKNAVLPLIFATLLAEGRHKFTNVPNLSDVKSACLLLDSFGCKTNFENGTLTVDVPTLTQFEAHYDIVRKMRASFLCLGPLLAKYGETKVSLPGGCAIGSRPINLHLEALKVLGAEVEVTSGYVSAKCSKLVGDRLLFDTTTVGGTENILMAAVLAEGTTVIENAAKEPEVVDLANYLIKMGADIKGAGTSIVTVNGVKELKPAEHSVIPDRIEAGTLLIAGAITKGDVTVTGCIPSDLSSLLEKMRESGFEIEETDNSVRVKECSSWKAIDATTAPHPGFATDLQAQFMVLMTQAEGTSVITENVFENRFMHVQELSRLGADITPKSRVAVVRGKNSLQGAPVMATDLRASASLVLAGLIAKGETQVNRVYHLDRGYENLEEKLTSLGANVERKRQ